MGIKTYLLFIHEPSLLCKNKNKENFSPIEWHDARGHVCRALSIKGNERSERYRNKIAFRYDRCVSNLDGKAAHHAIHHHQYKSISHHKKSLHRKRSS